MTEITAKTPWAGHTGDVPLHLDYFDGSMFEALELVAKKYPRNIAFDFMGKPTTYPQMIEEIKKCARSLKTIGVRAGDKVTIAMPNCPQAIYMFYAVNLVGGIANMIHPLSAEKEIEFYLNESESVTAITLDQFYNKFESIRQNTKVVNIIIASVKDELSKPVRAGYMLTEGRKIAKIPKDAPVIRWKEFMNMGKACFWNYSVRRTGDDPAVILYSGGTTGTTKGIVLTNRNFNALGQQVIAANPMFNPGDKMLAAMPLFHGFGLGVCIHTMLSQGGRCILVPRFTAKSYAKLITKYHCNFIAGVPTLYEALLRLPSMEGADLSSLKGVFSGGDSLSIELKKKLDKFLYAHGAPVQVREGYGTTETVTACCLTPPHMFKEGSIGVPFPDTYIKIVEPGTDQEVPYGTEGEILLAGPTVMKEYMKHPDETAQTLRRHADGLTWVYTGDLGTMDSEGFVYFRGRAKRMIVSSGYNVYPGQIENILDANEMVQMSCVIGIPDAYRMQKVKAFVKLAAGIPANDATRQALMSYCSKHIAKYAMPCDIEFRDELPKTLVGKVAYRVLEEEEQAKHAAEAPAAPAEEEKKYGKKRAAHSGARFLFGMERSGGAAVRGHPLRCRGRSQADGRADGTTACKAYRCSAQRPADRCSRCARGSGRARDRSARRRPDGGRRRAARRRFPPRCADCAGRAAPPRTRGRERRWCSRRRSARRPTTASASTPFSADFIVGTKHSNFFPKMGNKGMRCMLFRREMQEKANFAKK